MALLNHIFLGIFILEIYVHAAPGDVSKIEDLPKEEKVDNTDEAIPEVLQEESIPTETPRQKRYYNPYQIFPPNPPNFPDFSRRDYFSTGNFRTDDPLAQIHKRVQELANLVGQPQIPTIPHVPHIPVYYPVLVVPPVGCACSPTNPTPTNNQQLPDIGNRASSVEDERQNWGLFMNNTQVRQAGDIGSDFSRPISFDPIKPDRPSAVPPPPVEHGTIQGSDNNGQSQFSTTVPPQSQQQGGFGDPANFPVSPFPNYPQNDVKPSEVPSSCDSAILMCCHQSKVMYSCFINQGCSSVTTYSNPCNPKSILAVIDKYQRYYGINSG